ncbi:MAG: PDZ domain-containing protein [Planctomycetota bacterium]
MRWMMLSLVVVVLAVSSWWVTVEDGEAPPAVARKTFVPPQPSTAVTPSRVAPKLDPAQEAALKAKEYKNTNTGTSPLAPDSTQPATASADAVPGTLLPAKAGPPDDSRPYLGIVPSESPSFEQLKAHLHVPCDGGTIIAEVAEGSPSFDRFKAFDIITSINGLSIKSGDELRVLLNDRRPGENILFDVIRRDSPVTVRITLGNVPEELKKMDESKSDLAPEELEMQHKKIASIKSQEQPDSGAWLGVVVTESDRLLETLQVHRGFSGGVCVQNVVENSVALKEGIAPGDVILEFNGTPLNHLADLQERLRNTGWNTNFSLTLLHQGQHRTITTFIPKSR